jgi:tetratricopeptide (TPR) repeat protein
VLDQTLQCSPQNVLLLSMRGEAAKQCGCGCRSGVCQSCRPLSSPGTGTAAAQAAGWFESALQLSPTNIRARLGLARADVELLRYNQALAEYQTVLRYVPDDINVLRETGRTLDSVQGIRRAAAVYGSPLADSAQTQLRPTTPSNPPESPFMPGAETDEPGIVLGQLVSHEYEARLLRNWKDHRAVAWYEQSVCVEPTNEQAYFDLGQANSAINRTHAAIDAYGQLLTTDPCHRDAATAFNRLQLELRPKTIIRYDYLYQNGRQGLANMTVADYSVGQRYSLGDENEFIEAGFRQRVLYPTDGPFDLGEIVYSRVQKKVALDTLAFAEVNVEQYQYGFKTRPTFTSGLQLLTRNDAQITLGTYLNNVYANGESIRQDIYRYGPQLDLFYRPTHWWDVTGMYRFANYSDHNTMNEAFLRTGYLLLEGRRRLKALGTYQYLTYAQQSIFGTNPFDPILGTVHPYFSPRNFSYGTLGLEWKQWLSCDTFKGANELWYLVYAGAGVDSNGQGYVLGNAQINYDITPLLSWVTDARLTRADVYNATGVSSFLVYRWR